MYVDDGVRLQQSEPRYLYARAEVYNRLLSLTICYCDAVAIDHMLLPLTMRNLISVRILVLVIRTSWASQKADKAS